MAHMEMYLPSDLFNLSISLGIAHIGSTPLPEKEVFLIQDPV